MQSRLFWTLGLLAVISCDGRNQGALSSQESKGSAVKRETPEQAYAEVKPVEQVSAAEGLAVEPFSAEAQAPVVVSGAYLTCSTTVENRMLACELMNKDHSSMALPNDMILRWAIVDKNGLRSAPVRVNRMEAIGGHSTFFVSVADMESKILVEANSSLGSMVAEFDLSSMGVSEVSYAGVTTLQGRTLARINQSTVVYMGDEFADPTTAECEDMVKTSTTVGPFARYSQSFTVTGPTILTARVYLAAQCGLDSSRVTIQLVFPDKRTVKTRLVPSATMKDFFVTEAMDFPPGTYSYVMQMESAANGGFEDFFFGALFLTADVLNGNQISNVTPLN